MVKKLDSKSSLKNIPSARQANHDAIDDALMDEGIGKLLDSNGFEIKHSNRLNNQFLQLINNGQAAGQGVQQDIMPDYMIEGNNDINKKPPSMHPQ
mgnify:CR=1 FL=1